MGDDVARWRPTPVEWSANECVGHLVEADRRGFAGRIRRILAENGVAEAGWNQLEVAAARRDVDRSSRRSVDEFVSGRDDGIALVEGLGPDDLDQFAIHDRSVG